MRKNSVDESPPILLSFSSPFGSQKRFLPSSLMETLVCMPLPLTPTTGFGRKRGGEAHVGCDLAADQLVELNLIGGGDNFTVPVVDFKLRRRDFGMILLILKSHGALHFGGGVDEGAQRIARQRVVIAAGIHVFELAGLVIAALGIGPFEKEALDFVGGVQRVALLLVKLVRVSFENAANVAR